MKQFIFLSFVIFFSNAFIMIFEIIGIRILWPYAWTSIVTWSSIIAIVLFFLSLGNYFWGKKADSNINIWDIQYIFLISSIILWGIFVWKDIILQELYVYINHIEVYVIVVSIVLFGPLSYLLWMISPMVMKILITSLDTTWVKVWWVSWLWAAWGILWTLVTWFFLISNFGIDSIIYILWFSCYILSVIGFCFYKERIFSLIEIASALTLFFYMLLLL